MKGRDIRRFHERRMKNKAKKLLKLWGREEFNKSEIGFIASTHGCPCSCAACGNPRRHFGELTIQERKANMRDRIEQHWDANEFDINAKWDEIDF